MPGDINALIAKIKKITFNIVTLPLCEALVRDVGSLTSAELAELEKGLTEQEKINIGLFLTLGIKTYHKIQVFSPLHHLHKWLEENNFLFVFLTKLTQDLTQDPFKILNELFDVKKDSEVSTLHFVMYSAEKEILHKISVVNENFIEQIKKCFENIIQLYMYPTEYEKYFFDTYLPERDAINDLEQNMVELALVNPKLFCYFIRHEPLKAACFSKYDEIAKKNPLVVYAILLELRDYTESLSGVCNSLVSRGYFQLVKNALSYCTVDAIPGWITGLTNAELFSFYQKDADIFWAILSIFPARLMVLLRDKDIFKCDNKRYVEIFNHSAYKLSDAEYFDACDVMSDVPAVVNSLQDEARGLAFNLYWLLGVGNSTNEFRETIKDLPTADLYEALTIIFAVRSYKNIDPKKLAHYFPAQTNDILWGEDYYGNNANNQKLEEICGNWEILKILFSELNIRYPVPHHIFDKMLNTPVVATCLFENITELHANHLSIFTKLMRNEQFALRVEVKAIVDPKTQNRSSEKIIHGTQKATIFAEKPREVKREPIEVYLSLGSSCSDLEADLLMSEFEESLTGSMVEEFEESLALFAGATPHSTFNSAPIEKVSDLSKSTQAWNQCKRGTSR